MNLLKTNSAILVFWSLVAAPAVAQITNVVETGGDNETTDTITAKWTGVTWNVTQANEPIPGAIVGQPYTVGTFGHGAPAFVDRNHRYFDDLPNNLPIPAYLNGAQYIMAGNDNRDNATYRLDVTVSSPVTTYMLIDNRLGGNNADPPTFGPTAMQWILDQGWLATNNGLNRTMNTAVPDEVGIDEGADGGINQWYSLYKKDFAAGTFSLLQPDNAGQNMYGVVIVPSGPPPVPGDTDGDGIVEFSDFEPIRANFRKAVSERTGGDLVDDNVIDFDDFHEWKTAFVGGGGSVAGMDLDFFSVPEPASAALAVVAFVSAGALIRNRRS
ncbi:MAG TPA: hypothetical protein VJ828_05430 [Lacipirellulaceae bacterium]|nr:hypothetical protein [Lacipirellulaceae bacterium]